MNLHFFNDEIGHYMEATYNRIEKLQPNENYFINIAYNPIKNNENIFYSNNLKEIFNKAIELQPIKRVYFHYYNYICAFINKELKKNKIISIWVFWSGDFYNLPKFVPNVYLPYSQNYIPKINKKQFVKNKIRNAILFFKGNPYFNHQKFIQSISNIDFIACILENDYLNIIKEVPNNPPKHLPFAYLSYEQFLKENENNKILNGFDIMVNHSADPTLNHYEVLELLHSKKVKNKIFIPLVYGDKEYKLSIINYIESLKILNVDILDSFINSFEYNQKLRKIGFAIFNSTIQQGFGNIIVLMWFGVKIFLREENSIYKDFKNWGLNIFSVQNDLPNEYFEFRLTQEQIAWNRSILIEKLSESKVNEFYLNILTI